MSHLSGSYIDSIPKWPDFTYERGLGTFEGQAVWKAVTNAGRPGSPIFAALFTHPEADGEPPYEIGRAELDRRYAQAHPNGCPGT